jgi:hypothetical protein
MTADNLEHDELRVRVLLEPLRKDDAPVSQARLDCIKQRVLAQAQQHARHNRGGGIRRRWAWRGIVAAACIAMAIAAGGILFHAAQPSPAYAELAKAVATTKAAEWVHLRGTLPDHSTEGQLWISFRPYRRLFSAGGRLGVSDGVSQTSQFYDPAEGTIQILPMQRDKWASTADSFYQATMAYMEQEVADGTSQLVCNEVTIDGKSYTQFETVSRDSTRGILRILVDRADGRVASIMAGPADKPIAAKVDYPATAPADLYALGAPRDAKIVSLLPTPEVTELDRRVQMVRDAFAPSYYALICTVGVERGEDGQEHYEPAQAHRVYKRDGKYRIEIYALDGRIDCENVQMVEQSIDRDVQRGGRADVTFVGKSGSITVLRPDRPGDQVTRRRDRGSAPAKTVEELTWGGSWSTIRGSVQPASQEDRAGWLVRQHSMEDGQPAMRIYYDPQHSYVRRLSEHAAPSRGVLNVRIEELAQTPTGQWYARRVLTAPHAYMLPTHPSGSEEEKLHAFVDIVHLDTTKEIPSELMDPKRVGPEWFRPQGR